MSTSPPPPGQPSEQPSGQPSEQPSEQRRLDPKRNLAGVGFALLGGYFAYSIWGVDMSGLLKAVLLVVFGAVAVYGVVQLLQNRRR